VAGKKLSGRYSKVVDQTVRHKPGNADCRALALLLTAPTYDGGEPWPNPDRAVGRRVRAGIDRHIRTGSKTMIDILAAGAGAADAPPAWINLLPIVGMVLIFWFLIIRPQMKRQKEHQEKIGGLKKGDQVVTAGGLVGKVVKIDDTYADIELAQGVRVKAVKSTIGDIIPPGGSAAND